MAADLPDVDKVGGDVHFDSTSEELFASHGHLGRHFERFCYGRWKDLRLL